MKSSRTHLPSLLTSLTFVLGSVILIGIGLIAGVTALLAYMIDRSVEVPSIIFSFVYGFEGLLVGVAAFFAILKFIQKPYADQTTSTRLTIWNLLLGGSIVTVVLMIGNWANERASINWILLPVLTIPAVAVPIWLLIKFGAQKLPLGPRWQTWSMLGLGMTLAPLLIIIFETMALIAIGILIVIYLIAQPDRASRLLNLSQQMMQIQPDSPEMINALRPFITHPITIILIFMFFSIIVPILEEMIKPLGLWLFGKKTESVAQGFAFGALCGAGYALAETYGVSGQVAQWSTIVVMRIGTGLLHITASAIMGAGITAALRHKRYLFLLGSYMLSVLLHGSWNAATIAYSYSISGLMPDQIRSMTWIKTGTSLGLPFVSVILISLLLFNNRKYRKTILPAPEEVTSLSIAEPQDQITP